MWTRSQLKDNAKSYLKPIYLMAFAVSLIMAFIGSSGPLIKFNLWERVDNPSMYQEQMEEQTWVEDIIDGSYMSNFIPEESFRKKMDGKALTDKEVGQGLFIATLALGIVALVLFFVLLLRIFIFNPLILGGKKFFLNAAQDRSESFSDMGFAFSSGHYWNIILTLFLKNLFIFLWSLLLLIPGVIKTYAYAMVPYLLAENPEMEYKEALETSDDMTRGHKWEMFVLDLSFLGWYLLASLLFGLGFYFVHPYYNATHAELYLALKDKASLTIDYDGFEA